MKKKKEKKHFCILNDFNTLECIEIFGIKWFFWEKNEIALKFLFLRFFIF